jgi:hypothetical protein
MFVIFHKGCGFCVEYLFMWLKCEICKVTKNRSDWEGKKKREGGRVIMREKDGVSWIGFRGLWGDTCERRRL